MERTDTVYDTQETTRDSSNHTDEASLHPGHAPDTQGSHIGRSSHDTKIMMEQKHVWQCKQSNKDKVRYYKVGENSIPVDSRRRDECTTIDKWMNKW